MAARKIRGTVDTGWPQQVRERIQGAAIIKRLEDHVMGKAEMTMSQIRAADIVLRKVLPDLSAVEMSGEVDSVSYVICASPGAFSAADDPEHTRWLDKYAPKDGRHDA